MIDVANLGTKPYLPLHAYFYLVHINLGFLPAGEIIWQKAKGANEFLRLGVIDKRPVAPFKRHTRNTCGIRQRCF